MLREALLQFQQQVALYERLGKEVGGPRDDAELRAQLRAQEAVVKVRERGKCGMEWGNGRVRPAHVVVSSCMRGCVCVSVCVRLHLRHATTNSQKPNKHTNQHRRWGRGWSSR